MNSILKKYNSFGFCTIKNVLTKKEIQNIQEIIIDRVNLDYNQNFKKSDFDKNFFHKYLLNKRKESPKKFSKFYNSLQTNVNIFTISSNKKIKKFNMSMGDILLMDSRVIHRSGKNLSNKFRFTILVRMVSSFNKTFIPGRLIYRYYNEYNKKLLKL